MAPELAARAFGLGRHAGTALEVRGFSEFFLYEPIRGAFAQFEWYRGLSFVSFFSRRRHFFLFSEKKIRMGYHLDINNFEKTSIKETYKMEKKTRIETRCVQGGYKP